MYLSVGFGLGCSLTGSILGKVYPVFVLGLILLDSLRYLHVGKMLVGSYLKQSETAWHHQLQS